MTVLAAGAVEECYVWRRRLPGSSLPLAVLRQVLDQELVGRSRRDVEGASDCGDPRPADRAGGGWAVSARDSGG